MSGLIELLEVKCETLTGLGKGAGGSILIRG